MGVTFAFSLFPSVSDRELYRWGWKKRFVDTETAEDDVEGSLLSRVNYFNCPPGCEYAPHYIGICNITIINEIKGMT